VAIPPAGNGRILMRSFSYILYNYLLKPILRLYLKFDILTRFDGFRVKILKGVFHPKLYFSTKYLYEFLKSRELKNKIFLEIGCGTGVLSLLARRMGAAVTSVDIDPKAVENTRINFSLNFKNDPPAEVIPSDVFSNLNERRFNFILINPPYYFKPVKSDSQYAWYCGENGEFFESLFSGLEKHVLPGFEAYMVLEEGCDLYRISSMAARYQVSLLKVDERTIRWEQNFIYRLNLLA
jgi:release factor glutamine methyltransferase